MTLHWSVQAWMWPLLLVLAAGAVLYVLRTYGMTRPDPGKGLRRALVVLRSLVLAGLVLAVGGPFLVLLQNMRETPELVVVVDDSGSMGFESSLGAVASRWDRALNLMARMDQRLQGRMRVVGLRGNGLEAVRESGSDSLLEPASVGGDLGALVEKARFARKGRNIGGMVLFSDGGETIGGMEEPQSPAGESRLLVVGLGDRAGPEDRFLTDIRYPRLVQAGDEMEVEVTVAQRNHRPVPGDSLQVVLKGPEGTLARLTREDTGEAMTFPLVLRLEQEGLQVLTVSVSPLVNERFPANNSASLAVTVGKSRARILLLALTPSWDARFLAQAAQWESSLKLVPVVNGPRAWIRADSAASWTWPAGEHDWKIYDGVVLLFAGADIAGDFEFAPLAAAVRSGLGLLMVPGPGFSRAERPLRLPTSLAEILPIDLESGRWKTGEFFLAPRAASHAVLAGVAGAGKMDSGRWDFLPPLSGVLNGSVRPDAQVLLDASGRQGPAYPVLVLGEADRGRVAWYGGDALWTVAFRPDNSGAQSRSGQALTGRRLLRNLLVWIGLGDAAGGLRIDGDPGLVAAGQPLVLAGSWRDLRGEAVREGRAVLEVRPRDGGQVRTFQASDPDPVTGAFTVSVDPLGPGPYTLQLRGEGPNAAVSPPVALEVAGESPERLQVRQDVVRLRQLASTWSGEYLDGTDSVAVARLLDEIAALPALPVSHSRRNRIEATGGLPFLALLVMLLGVEWYLRRRSGLL